MGQSNGAEMDKKKFKDLYRISAKTTAVYCYLCGKIIDPKDLSFDHREPYGLSGNGSLDNLYPCHKNCNTDKGMLNYEQYRLYQALNRVRHGGKDKVDLDLIGIITKYLKQKVK